MIGIRVEGGRGQYTVAGSFSFGLIFLFHTCYYRGHLVAVGVFLGILGFSLFVPGLRNVVFHFNCQAADRFRIVARHGGSDRVFGVYSLAFNYSCHFPRVFFVISGFLRFSGGFSCDGCSARIRVLRLVSGPANSLLGDVRYKCAFYDSGGVHGYRSLGHGTASRRNAAGVGVVIVCLVYAFKGAIAICFVPAARVRHLGGVVFRQVGEE